MVFPLDGSHWVNMKVILEDLHSRGHNLTVIRASNSWYIPEQSPLYTSISVEMDENEQLRVSKCFHVQWKQHGSCILQSMLDSKYELMLTDPAIAPGLYLAKFLKLPVVLNVRWITSGEGHFALAPSPLSYIPVAGSGLTDKMNFIQRVKNFLFSCIDLFQQKFMVEPCYFAVREKYFEGRFDTISLLLEADIWLFRSDFVFDYPRPTMPNVVYIGGFQCKPAQPLPVIWRHKGATPSTLGNNTLIVDWMPQKDLLGHPQIKLFVAHGGTNGVQEAIYHGVPVLGIPLFFDQYDNLLRLQDRGAAKILELSDLNADTFEQGIQELLHTDSYRMNIQRMSRLHRDQPLAPMDQAVFWVEYVMRHKGAPHLRTEAYRMPWYSYYSLDVLLLMLTVLTALIVSTLGVFRFLCCRRIKKSKAKQN
uniref:UDP-glucuronosyltransferase n=1 Tax=Salarias fasciatus TaxID=181472 RepID=A0A672GH11_SALFA